MNRLLITVTILAVLSVIPAYAQDNTEDTKMSFFITSVGLGDGANLGGLAGADRHCQALAETAGAGGKTWRAYLSASASNGRQAVNARDRIGEGPWQSAYSQFFSRSFRIAQNLSELHGDTLAEARHGNSINKYTALSENGDEIKGVGDTPNEHDILTGTQLDGRAYADQADHTCSNWTSNSEGSAQVGHHDRIGFSGISWVSAHPSNGCSQENLVSSGGAGLFYCFATD